MCDLSIVIVSWNTRELLNQCLRSIKEGCGGLKLELLVVDNASSDGTAEMVVQDFPEVTLIRNETNLGFARANNIGMRAATAKCICLINSDVTVPPGCLQSMLKYMEKTPSIGLLGPKMLAPGGVASPSCMRSPSLLIALVHALGLSRVFKSRSLHMTNLDYTTVQEVDVLNGWFWMARSTAVAKVGMLDPRFFMYGEDKDWCKRFHDAGWRVVFYPEVEATHYGGGSSRRAPIRFYLEMQRANLQYWKLHKSLISQVAYVFIVILHHVSRVVGYGAAYALNLTARSEAAFKVRRSAACLLWLSGVSRVG